MNKQTLSPIGLFYGSSTCYTEMTAYKIRDLLGENAVDIHNIVDAPPAKMAEYSQLILGIPTWDYGELQEDWENIWDEIDSIDLSGKTIALYGQGDQYGYPDWFLDAMGYLHNKVLLAGATLIGYWPNQGYEFNESQALTEDKSHFVGLALDDEGQFELSEQRLQQWCRTIATEFSLTTAE